MGEGDDSTMMDAAGFVRKHTGLGTDGVAKATNNPSYGQGNELAITHHLALAIDLDPRSVRTIRAMGEGAHAALQSAARKTGIFETTAISVSLDDPSTSIFLAGTSGGVHPDPAADNSTSRYAEPEDPEDQEEMKL